MPTTANSSRSLLSRSFLIGMVACIAVVIGVAGWLLWPEIELQILIHNLHHADSWTRYCAASELEEFGMRARSAAPILRALLEDDDELVRTAAAATLACTGIDREASAPVLASALRQWPPHYWIVGCGGVRGFRQPEPREIAERAAYRLGNDGSSLILAALRHTTPTVRAWGVYFALAYDAPNAELSEALRPLIRDDDALVRISAAAALAHMNEPNDSTYSVVIDAITRREHDLDAATTRLISELGSGAVPWLLRALRERDDAIRACAAHRIGWGLRSGGAFYPRANLDSAALGELFQSLDDENTLVRLKVAVALSEAAELSEIDGGPERVADVLIQSLQDHELDGSNPCSAWFDSDLSATARWEAANALGTIGTVCDRIVPTLVAALSDENSRVRSSAAWALGNFRRQADEAVPALIARLSDQDYWVRKCTASALGALGPAAGDAIPALETARNDNSDSVRVAATESLRKIRN